jgi:hypothetical protein
MHRWVGILQKDWKSRSYCQIFRNIDPSSISMTKINRFQTAGMKNNLGHVEAEKFGETSSDFSPKSEKK